MIRSHNRLVLLVILAMLTFALTNLQAQSSATNSAPSIAATNTNAPIRPISDAQFKKILTDTQANGKTASLPANIAAAFGVSNPAEKEVGDPFNDPTGRVHIFFELDNGNYIFCVSEKHIAYNYYVDKNLTLKSALSVNDKKEITILSNKDAQGGLNAEFAFFADIANQL
jgi:hypothetical protein